MDPFELESRYVARNYEPLPVVLTRGSGAYLWDVEGRRYIDMMSAYSAASHGHGHPRILAALEAQAHRLAVPSRAYYNDRLGPFLAELCKRTGLDVAPGQVDLGTTNEPFADPAPQLPLFKLTCKEGYRPHPHLGRVVYTQDPGFALTTGRCTDIGKITIQQMRGLAGRAPYFSNGSAATLRGIVDFYDRRYNIGYSEQEKQDLVNLMSVL